MKRGCTTILILLLFCVSCKKGKEDPFISMRSREDRVAGKWELTNMIIDGVPQDLGNQQLHYTFKKDGSGEIVNETAFGTQIIPFTWDFLQKGDGFKNKERIIITDAQSVQSVIYEISQLRNKSMKWMNKTVFARPDPVERILQFEGR